MLKLKDKYIDEIENNFFPYWIQFIDEEYGGILNCISNDGKEKLSDQKFTWSQGRWLWVLGRIHDLNKDNIFQSIDNEKLEKWMDDTYKFIVNNSIYGDSICCFVLERDGTKILDKNTGSYDASIYADCFALIGMSQYIKTTKKVEYLDDAILLYESIVKRIESGNYKTEPYPIPEGYSVHGIPMILVNTIYEYVKMRQRLGLSSDNEIEYGARKVRFILEELYDGKYIREHFSTQDNANTRLIDRHINPGHTLEDLWFLIEYLDEFLSLDDYLVQICNIAKDTFELGWDKEYGGLLRFVDVDGGAPKGELIDTPYEQLIIDTWDMKLWWPHSEVLYLFPLLYKYTGDRMMADLYNKSEEYAFSTFPNKETGEWTQIRKRGGEPQDKVVALPVKDPFHILRNFIKIVELETE